MSRIPPHLYGGLSGIKSIRPTRKHKASINASGIQGNLRFRVVHVKTPEHERNTLLQVNVIAGTFLISSPTHDLQEDEKYDIGNIRYVEKSKYDPTRIVIHFQSSQQQSKPDHRSCDLIFIDNPTLECFCDLVHSLNRNVRFRYSKYQKLPKWIPDEQVYNCAQCAAAFSFTNRKHHCRSCGNVFCSSCSSHVAILPNLGYSKWAVRVCDKCFTTIRDSRVAQNMGKDISPQGQFSIPHGQQNGDVPIDSYGFSLLAKIEQMSVSHTSKEEQFNEILKFEEDYKLVIRKQRDKWNKYLTLHTKLENRKSSRHLARDGIPPELRGYIWQIMCGSKNKQSSFPKSYYHDLVREAASTENNTILDIEKDLHRTFPHHAVYGSAGSKGIGTLRRVLQAYSLHNPRVGYCQSMNFVSALLLLFMEEEEAFWMLSCIVEDLTAFEDIFYYQSDLCGVRLDLYVFSELVKEKLPKVYRKFQELNIEIEPLTLNWFLCLFIHSVPLETTLRVWDVFFFYGIRMMFRAALTMLKINEKLILKAKTIEQLMTFLKAFTKSALDCDAFIKTCFDYTWIGSISRRKITFLRRRFKSRLDSQQVESFQDDQVCSGGEAASPSRMEPTPAWPLRISPKCSPVVSSFHSPSPALEFPQSSSQLSVSQSPLQSKSAATVMDKIPIPSSIHLQSSGSQSPLIETQSSIRKSQSSMTGSPVRQSQTSMLESQSSILESQSSMTESPVRQSQSPLDSPVSQNDSVYMNAFMPFSPEGPTMNLDDDHRLDVGDESHYIHGKVNDLFIQYYSRHTSSSEEEKYVD